ncbi:MAG: hypothetical protein JXQ67_11330 [Campylobacterales bacterium]|nr:hypothetical protein [Campylobacterales bacterium]
MKKVLLSSVAVAALMSSANLMAAEDGLNIFSDIKLKGEIRPRYEVADVKDNGVEKGQAFTARTHLAVTAGLLEVQGLSATVGIQTVNNFGYTNYSPASTNYDKILDPQAAMLSEASVDYVAGKTAIHAGRSQLNLDNQRFIGTVGWRQLERSYDTLAVTNTDVENLELMAAYLYGYAGVGGTTTTETSSVILHAKYKVMDELTITAYDYMIGSSNDTLGIALTGNATLEGVKLDYRAEYAMQSDPTMEYRVKDVKADATYYNLDLGTNISGILAGVNYEFLSGTNGTDGKTNFNPAFGTNHKFNGWADVFFVGNTGPTGGLKDFNLRLGYTAAGLGKILAMYHDFKSDVAMTAGSGTSDNLGSEIDVVYTNAIPGVKGLAGLLKFASYSKGDVTSFANATKDKQVAWAQLDYKF